MSGFGTFLSLVFAFLGTTMILFDPAQKLVNWSRGKKESDLKKSTEEYMKQKSCLGLLGQGCSLTGFYLLALAFTFVIEPIAIISALTGKIGYQPFAWLCLGIEAIAWIITIRSFRKMSKTLAESAAKAAKKEDSQPETGIEIIEPDGTVVIANGEVVDKEIEMPHPAVLLARKAFFALPTMFLWYLFAIGIGLLH